MHLQVEIQFYINIIATFKHSNISKETFGES